MKRIADINAAKEYVRNKCDLQKIISEDIGDREWKEEGSNTLVTTSPFREETKPSFKVRGDRFKDWGGEQHGGDVFFWVQLWHGLKFEESIIHVADRSGIDIGRFLRDPTEEELVLSRYKYINQLAAEWTHDCFRTNASIRDDYLSRSGFTLDKIEPYQVGYCPTPDALIHYLSSKVRLTEDDVQKLELSRRDLFTNAITYPVHSHSGEVLFFYTRRIEEDSHYTGMKAEHPLHDLGVIYGFHVAKKNFRKNGAKLILVEGQRDAIAFTAGGILGSELRDKQLESIKEYKIKELIFCYDNDHTGWTKSLGLINKPRDFSDILVSVTSPRELDSDPHDAWKQFGDGAIYQALSDAKIPLEYYITRGGFNLESLTDKHRLLTSLKDYLVKLNGLHLSIAISYLSNLLDSPKDSINEYIAEVKASYSNLFNLEAERTLIAHCMRVSASFNAAVAANINKDAFTYSKFGKLFQACRIAFDEYGESYTPQVVLDKAMAESMDQDLPNVVQGALDGNYKYEERVACDIVLDMYRRRVASEQAIKLKEAASDLAQPFAELVNIHRKNLITSVSSSRPQARTPQELSKELYEEVKYRERLGGNLIIGYDFFSLPSINMVLGGIQPGHMVVIGGDTGAGKSILGMNILSCLAVKGNVRTLWIGQEMQSKENSMRLASIACGLNNTRLQTGGLSQKDAQMFALASKTIAESGYYMAQPKYGSIEEILAIIDEYRWRYDIQAVIWDYIGMVAQSEEGQRGWNREQVLGNASTTIKNRVTVDMGLPVIVIAQLNRDKFAQGKQKIAGSYRILQDADDFLWIEAKSKKQLQEDGAGRGNRYIRIGKRRGGLDDFMIHANMDVDPRTNTLQITECSSPSEQSKLYSQLVSLSS